MKETQQQQQQQRKMLIGGNIIIKRYENWPSKTYPVLPRNLKKMRNKDDERNNAVSHLGKHYQGCALCGFREDPTPRD